MLFAADPPAKKIPAPAAAVKDSTGPGQIPAAAVESEPGSFHYTDAQGKKWIYRKTPFGVARWQDDSAAEAARKAEPSKSFDNVTATADGDTIRFERPGPFGTYRWTKQKSELNEMEQAAWARARGAGQK
jgi:hypothetical protein